MDQRCLAAKTGRRSFIKPLLGLAVALLFAVSACLMGGCAQEQPVEGSSPTYVSTNTTSNAANNAVGNSSSNTNVTVNKSVDMTASAASRSALEVYDDSVDTTFVDYVEMTRSDVASNAEYANFRRVTVGNIKPGRLYRSASPLISPRGSYCDLMLESAGIKSVINLANQNEAEVQSSFTQAGFNSQYYKSLFEQGRVGIYYVPGEEMFDETAGSTYVKALIWISRGEGPYLVHCAIGRDRTGFLIMMIESLCGASWEEMKDDFMTSFANLSLVTKEEDPDVYWKIVDTWFISRAESLTNRVGGDPLNANDIKAGTIDYLKTCGMTQEEIDLLVKYLTG